jgi:mannose-1-phosphate guanylyltransferase
MKQESQEGQLWGIILAVGDGARVCGFLSQLCENREIKQFCAVVGRRSRLEHTLARVEMLIPRQRILVVVSGDHQPEISQQLAHWPVENVILQPENRDTTAGILLPLAHIAHRDPHALEQLGKKNELPARLNRSHHGSFPALLETRFSFW